MTTEPRNDLPLLYKALVPLNTEQHSQWRSRTTDKAGWLVGQHIVPLTVDEFVEAQRHFPIVFSGGEKPIPLALMGLNENVNVFVDKDGTVAESVYIPAYARRYPFMLARVSTGQSDLSLCFDPTTDLVGDFTDGNPLFEGESPTAACKATLKFCEEFEIAGQKTEGFSAELDKHDLLIDGETTIQPEGADQSFVYRGFRIVDETRLRGLPGEVLAEWNGNGLLPLIYFHLASLHRMRDIFARQANMVRKPEQ
jgi:hypothetical protein